MAILIVLLCFVVSKQHKALVQKDKELKDKAYVAENVSKEIVLTTLTKQIQSIGELATIEYLYTDAGEFSDAMQIKGFDIPLTKKSFLVKWDGVIKAGIDVGSVTMSVDEKSKTINVQIPQAKILSHEIDNDSLETLDESNNIFNKIKVDDVNSFIGESKDFMEQRVIDNGILEKAAENTENLITTFLKSNSIIGDDYDVEIEVSKEKQ